MDTAGLVTTDLADPFAYLEPPFQLNAPEIARYPVEVTGYRLLQRIWTRLGWDSLAGRRLLDLGCGVRFARTIHNLALPVGEYAGMDVQADVIAWLQEHLGDDPRFRFAHLDARNRVYRPEGDADLPDDTLARAGLTGFDAACMHSVITHQDPDEAARTFRLLRAALVPAGRLHFTAFTDESIADFAEADPGSPGHMCTYHPGVLGRMLRDAGWRLDAIHPKDDGGLGQTTFVSTLAS